MKPQCPYCKNSTSIYPDGFSQSSRKTFRCLACQRTFEKRIYNFPIWQLLLGLVSSPLLFLLFLYIMARFPSPTSPVDAIVVLGRGPEQNPKRIVSTADLWQDQQAPEIFVSGMTDAPKMIQTLNQLGVVPTAVSGERCSQSTWENGLFSHVLLKPRGIKHILLVTDRPHMTRAALVFKGFGFEVTPSPIDLAGSSKKLNTQVREIGGLLAYAFSGKLMASNSNKLSAAVEEAHFKINKWKCHLSPATQKE